MRNSKSSRPAAHSLGMALGLSFGLALTACNQGSEPIMTGPGSRPSASPSAMDREITALKQKETDPAKLEAAYDAILARYGYPVAGPVGPGADIGPVLEETGPLPKSAAAVISWKGMKNVDFGYHYTFKRSVVVPAGARLWAFTNVGAAPTDPMLVAFYRTGGTATAATTKVVAFNDDKEVNGRDAEISWINNTGSTKVVEFMVFTYQASVTGSVFIGWTEPQSIIPFGTTRNIKAWAVRTHTHPGTFQGCTGPYQTRLWLRRKSGGGLQSGVLGVNWSAKRGGILLEEGAADRTLNLEDVLPNGGAGNLIVPFMLGSGTTSPATLFNAQQQDRYSCTIAPI